MTTRSLSKRPSKTAPRDVAAELEKRLAALPHVAQVDCMLADLAGTLRGKRYPRDEVMSVFRNGMQIPESLYLLDWRGEMTDPFGRGFGDGDPDGTAWPILETFGPVANVAPARAQVLMSMRDHHGEPSKVEPRNVLASVLQKFDELELTPVVALEVEFFLLDPARTADGMIRPPLCPASGERERAISVYGIEDLDRYGRFLEALTEACRIQNVPATAATSEYAPGQFEINLKHSSQVLQGADNLIFLKQCVKTTALAHQMRATFMAKPYALEAGSGLHVHASLLDKAGRNIFDDGSPEGSLALRHAIGGVAATMQEAMAVFAANPNAFRRYQPNLFVPMNRHWGVNNRSTGLRVPAGPGEARRLEHRVSGADANPYLVAAAVLAGMHHGLTNAIDPGPPANGNVSDTVDPTLPFLPETALAAMEAGSVLRSYWGEYVDIYCASKKVELERFRGQIAPHEYDWYL
ncbi:MAG: glutamine synthetase [Alphaproteobacteria bacterium]|nr:glutamine synthetase [Alphaproteobacteria bacterium]